MLFTMQGREFTLVVNIIFSSFLKSKLYLHFQRKLWSEDTAALESQGIVCFQEGAFAAGAGWDTVSHGGGFKKNKKRVMPGDV